MSVQFYFTVISIYPSFYELVVKVALTGIGRDEVTSSGNWGSEVNLAYPIPESPSKKDMKADVVKMRGVP